VEEYVIDFFDELIEALLLLLPFIAADIFIQYGRAWDARDRVVRKELASFVVTSLTFELKFQEL
jgi:hypothetical protein